ncbi:MAG TPA: ABC-2 family transporter protein [Chloroflexaceae bacterium]|nr:ABC-2 family transporter protein [Chloroflexaceae bacterium]
MTRELRFLLALWRANLQAAMEFRAAFLTQVVGMVVNNGLYFLFWVLFFERFEEVGGYGLRDVALLYGVAACAIGLGVYLFGNTVSLAEVIAEGKLDYYLALPRPALLHVLASRSVASGLGDASYGLLTFLVLGPHTLDGAARFALAVLCGAAVFVGFLVLVNSLAFWMGGASQLGGQTLMALVTFATYPITLFDGTAKLLLFTVMPAALIGSVPAAFVRGFGWPELAMLAAGAAGFLALALLVFQRGLRRYESGSAITAQS